MFFVVSFGGTVFQRPKDSRCQRSFPSRFCSPFSIAWPTQKSAPTRHSSHACVWTSRQKFTPFLGSSKNRHRSMRNTAHFQWVCRIDSWKHRHESPRVSNASNGVQSCQGNQLTTTAEKLNTVSGKSFAGRSQINGVSKNQGDVLLFSLAQFPGQPTCCQPGRSAYGLLGSIFRPGCPKTHNLRATPLSFSACPTFGGSCFARFCAHGTLEHTRFWSGRH